MIIIDACCFQLIHNNSFGGSALHNFVNDGSKLHTIETPTVTGKWHCNNFIFSRLKVPLINESYPALFSTLLRAL
jgi:hypothetical protein